MGSMESHKKPEELRECCRVAVQKLGGPPQRTEKAPIEVTQKRAHTHTHTHQKKKTEKKSTEERCTK